MNNQTARLRSSNAFDHLRLLAAGTVVLTHHFYVYQRPWSLEWTDPGAWAVGVFFAISGYLNSKSILRRRSLATFFVSRASRLYPALIFCVGSTVVLGAFVTTYSLPTYFGRETLDYFWRNSGLFFGQRSLLPGVFEANPVHGTNASLWTLPVEACFYVGLAFAAWAARFQRFALGFGAIVTGTAVIWLSHQSLASVQIAQLSLMFMVGMIMAAFEGRASATAGFIVAVLSTVVIGWLGGWVLGLSVAFAAGSVVAGNTTLPKALHLPTDLSYGIYLFAFPLQQVVVLLGFAFYPGLIVAALLTLFAAAISANAVEIPALALARRLNDRGTKSVVSPLQA